MSLEITGINFEKIGLDSSAIICLASSQKNLNEFKEKYCEINKKYYFAIESETETIGVLINSYNFSPDEARQLWKKVTSEINLNLIVWKTDQEDKQFFFEEVRNINNIISDNGVDPTLFVGDMDIKIISNFYMQGIMDIYTLDKAFKETCKQLDINTLKMPKTFISRMRGVEK